MTLSFFVTLSDSFNLTNIAWIHYVSIISIAMNLDGLIMSCKLAMTKFTKNTLCLRQRRHFVFVDILKSKEGGGFKGKGSSSKECAIFIERIENHIMTSFIRKFWLAPGRGYHKPNSNSSLLIYLVLFFFLSPCESSHHSSCKKWLFKVVVFI